MRQIPLHPHVLFPSEMIGHVSTFMAMHAPVPLYRAMVERYWDQNPRAQREPQAQFVARLLQHRTLYLAHLHPASNN